jgi:hypothetical protein
MILCNVNECLNRIGWKPSHLTFIFALWTSVLLPDGTTLMALIQMLHTMFVDVRLVGFHPPFKQLVDNYILLLLSEAALESI